ncbi:hypothetical protein DPMN_181305 [Dreissena polymorpha]|uniref:Uncharacterized protein n=1 Tax=Dreissena polymorpha TaxID=45954 RepID=A0A9D4I494_DREPO|nr:hypothetical protein DPMN_181305 [Dreissena polymorpha]
MCKSGRPSPLISYFQKLSIVLTGGRSLCLRPSFSQNGQAGQGNDDDDDDDDEDDEDGDDEEEDDGGGDDNDDDDDDDDNSTQMYTNKMLSAEVYNSY